MGYPLYVYGPHGTFRIVADDVERDLAVTDGFRIWDKTNPTAVLFEETSSPPPTRRGRPPKVKEPV